ncbi:MAG: flagellar export chaperone FliS [Thermoguttaceae bacterium]
MSATARDTYRTTEILTATPQRLQLMLIEGAIQFSLRARQYWSANQPAKATEALVQAQKIMRELIGGLDVKSQSDLVRRVAAIYNFVHLSLIEASCRKDEAKLAGAIRVLEIERETWRQVCAKLGSTTDGRLDQATFHQLSGPKTAKFPPLSMDSRPTEYSGGFSLDA